MAEEIDFEGLVEYLEQSFLDDVRNRAFAISRKEREEAYQNIMSAAKAYAKANSIPAERRVAKIVSNCINIIYHFYSLRIKSQVENEENMRTNGEL